MPSIFSPPLHTKTSTDQYLYLPQNSLPSSPSPRHLPPPRILPSHNFTPIPTPLSSPLTSLSSPHSPITHFPDLKSSFISEFTTSDPFASSPPLHDQNRIPSSPLPQNFASPSSAVFSARSRSSTEPDLRLPMHGHTRKPLSKYPASSSHPVSPPHSPTMDVSMGIKFLLSKPALPSPTRLSHHSPSPSEVSSPSWHTTPRKSIPRPLELDVSRPPFPTAFSDSDHLSRIGSLPSTGPLHSSQDSLLPSPSVLSMPVYWREQKPRNVLRRKSSAKVLGGLEKKNAPPSSSSSSSTHKPLFKESRSTPSRNRSLTPAGTVAHAYKQREDGSPTQQPPTKVSPASPSPSCPVYGTQSERNIAVGMLDDDQQCSSKEGYSLDCQNPQIVPNTEPRKFMTRKGILTRRVSSSWKRVTGGGVKVEESPSHGGHSSSRPSLHESPGSRSSSARDRGQSIDAGGVGTDPQHQHTRSASKTTQEGSDDSSKIWKLMKRISTGGLRDRFQADKSAPPVPAIPKELLGSNNSPRQSYAVQRDVKAKANVQKPLGGDQVVSTPKKNGGGRGPRPSVTTSSSSPNSSDVASARFFHKSHSRGSSVSSYGEETVPLFLSMGDQHHQQQQHHQHHRHIVPPRDLHEIADDDQKNDQGYMSSRSRSHYRSRDQSVRSTSSGEGRRRRMKSDDDDDGDDDQPHYHYLSSPYEATSRSPMSTSARPHYSYMSLRTHRLGEKPSIGGSGSQSQSRLLPDGNISLSPPPPPRRCRGKGKMMGISTEKKKSASERSGSGSGSGRAALTLTFPEQGCVSSPAESESMSMSMSPTGFASPVESVSVSSPGSSSPGVRSLASPTFARAWTTTTTTTTTMATTTSRSDPDAHAHCQSLQYRKLDEGRRRAPLTEREKSEIWDDLLERSAQAGGTLHLKGGELESDHLRFSGYSDCER